MDTQRVQTSTNAVPIFPLCSPTGAALTANPQPLRTDLSCPPCIVRVISFWNFLA